MHTEGFHPHCTKLLSQGLGDTLPEALEKLAHMLILQLLALSSLPEASCFLPSCYCPSLYLACFSSFHNLELYMCWLCAQ